MAGKTVLIVDDEAPIREMLAGALETAAFSSSAKQRSSLTCHFPLALSQ